MLNLEKPTDSYIFGFIQGDGHLYKQSRNRGRMSIELNIKDIDILEKIGKYLGYNYSIHERTRQTNFSLECTSAILTVCAREFRESLVDAGIPYGAKSSIICLPKTPFSEIDYFRGMIDADGSLGFTANQFPFLSLLISSDDIYVAYKQFLNKHLSIIKNVNRNKRDNVYNIVVLKEQAVALVNILYYNNAFSMNRKRELASKIKKWKRPKYMKIRNLKNESFYRNRNF